MPERSPQPILPPGDEPSAAFTPGPWNIRPEPFERSGSGYKSRLIGANIGPLGESLRHDSEALNGGIWVAEAKGPDAEANARLIAAAPDLLEALRAIVKPNGYDVGGNDGLNLERARAAIAKALGPSAHDTSSATDPLRDANT